jgi:hypothetical protein
MMVMAELRDVPDGLPTYCAGRINAAAALFESGNVSDAFAVVDGLIDRFRARHEPARKSCVTYAPFAKSSYLREAGEAATALAA